MCDFDIVEDKQCEEGMGMDLKQCIIFHPNLLKLDVVTKAHEHNDIMHVIGNIKVLHTTDSVKHLYVCIHVKSYTHEFLKNFFTIVLKFGAYNESIC
jgi:hypothetical protein